MSMDGHWTPAWHEDCARVGLAEPSTDLAQIKRAYAKTLRVTRPDDDAQAYQALREAYDRLAAFARRQAELAASQPQEASTSPGDEPGPAAACAGSDADADADAMASADAMAAAIALDAELALAERLPLSAEPEPISASEYPRPRPSAPSPPARPPVHAELRSDARADDRGGPRDEPPPDLPPVPTPAALCDEVATLIRRWPARVVHELPRLRALLSELPLEAQREASVRFADLVIGQGDSMPRPLLDLLRDHFDWSRDFRAERLFGPERMAALADVLDRHPEPITDPVALAEFSPSVRIARLAGSPLFLDQLKAWLGALLMGHALPLHLQWAGWQLLRRLGLDDTELDAVNKLIGRVRAGSVVVIGLWVAAFDLMLRHRPTSALDLGIVTTMGLVIFCTAMGYVCRVLDAMYAGRGWLPRKLAEPRWQRVSPWIGAACLAVAGAALQWAPLYGDDLAFAAIPALLLGVVLGLKGPLHMVATAVALWISLVSTLPWMNPVSAGLLGAWIAAGTSLYRLRLYVPNPDFRVQPRWPQGGPKAVLALLTVGLPTLMAWLSNISGMRVTLGAIAIAFAGTSRFLPAAGLPVHLHLLVLPGTFYLALAVLLAMQRAGWWLGRRMFREPQPTAA